MCPPQSFYAKALTPSMTVCKVKAFKEVIKVKLGHRVELIGLLSCIKIDTRHAGHERTQEWAFKRQEERLQEK